MVEINQPVPGYLERDIVDLSGMWGRRRGRSTVTRVWHGATRVEDADRYLSFLQEKGVRDYLRTPGILDVRIGRRLEQDKARYYPEDEEFLLEKEPTVLHYETYRVDG